jgi:hypothetical protein
MRELRINRQDVLSGKWLKTPEAALAVGCSVITVRKMLESGILNGIRHSFWPAEYNGRRDGTLPKKHWYVHVDEVKRYLQEHGFGRENALRVAKARRARPGQRQP